MAILRLLLQVHHHFDATCLLQCCGCPLLCVYSWTQVSKLTNFFVGDLSIWWIWQLLVKQCQWFIMISEVHEGSQKWSRTWHQSCANQPGSWSLERLWQQLKVTDNNLGSTSCRQWWHWRRLRLKDCQQWEFWPHWMGKQKQTAHWFNLSKSPTLNLTSKDCCT